MCEVLVPSGLHSLYALVNVEDQLISVIGGSRYRGQRLTVSEMLAQYHIVHRVVRQQSVLSLHLLRDIFCLKADIQLNVPAYSFFRASMDENIRPVLRAASLCLRHSRPQISMGSGQRSRGPSYRANSVFNVFSVLAPCVTAA